MEARFQKEFQSNTVAIWIAERVGSDRRRVAKIVGPMNGPDEDFHAPRPRVEWVESTGSEIMEPTLRLPLELWEALVREAVIEHAGKMPADTLLKDRLDIETERVDRLLGAVLGGRM